VGNTRCLLTRLSALHAQRDAFARIKKNSVFIPACRTDGKGGKDEIFVDVVERLTCTFNASGNLSQSQVRVQVDSSFDLLHPDGCDGRCLVSINCIQVSSSMQIAGALALNRRRAKQ